MEYNQTSREIIEQINEKIHKTKNNNQNERKINQMEDFS